MYRSTLVWLALPLLCLSMVIWPELPKDEARFNRPKPKDWKDKNLGQWCRNFTVNLHTQCQQASVFHQFNCCGEHNTECCFAIQGWVIVLGSLLGFVATGTLCFYLLLKFQMICIEKSYPPKVIYLEGKR